MSTTQSRAEPNVSASSELASDDMWWDDETWRAMKSPDECGMCSDALLAVNSFSDLIAELEHSFVRLSRNQSHLGYSIVVLKRHATELHDLTHTVLAGFWADVAAAGRALDVTLHPVRIDYLVMGHRMPHLHCHEYPHDPDGERRTLLADLRAALGHDLP